MQLRGEFITDTEHFFIFRNRSEITPAALRMVLRTLLARLGLDPSLYNIHSFHAGRSVDMLKLGYSISQIKAAGRWRSSAVYRYLKQV